LARIGRLLTPQIVAGQHPTTAVAQDNHSVGVLCHQSLVEPASNLQPLRALSIREGKISGLGGMHFCGPFDRMPLYQYATAVSGAQQSRE